jgi:hypothetical protein
MFYVLKASGDQFSLKLWLAKQATGKRTLSASKYKIQQIIDLAGFEI